MQICMLLRRYLDSVLRLQHCNCISKRQRHAGMSSYFLLCRHSQLGIGMGMGRTTIVHETILDSLSPSISILLTQTYPAIKQAVYCVIQFQPVIERTSWNQYFIAACALALAALHSKASGRMRLPMLNTSNLLIGRWHSKEVYKCGLSSLLSG